MVVAELSLSNNSRFRRFRASAAAASSAARAAMKAGLPGAYGSRVPMTWTPSRCTVNLVVLLYTNAQASASLVRTSKFAGNYALDRRSSQQQDRAEVRRLGLAVLAGPRRYLAGGGLRAQHLRRVPRRSPGKQPVNALVSFQPATEQVRITRDAGIEARARSSATARPFPSGPVVI